MSGKKIIPFLTIFSLTGLLFLVYITRRRSSIVYVDSNQLINNYKGMQDARKGYQEKAVSWRANIEKFLVRINKEYNSVK